MRDQASVFMAAVTAKHSGVETDAQLLMLGRCGQVCSLDKQALIGLSHNS